MQIISKRLWRKFDSWTNDLLRNHRINQIKNTDFSIICNNCWGGYVYRRYGLPYFTPTVGLYFFAPDFIKLCQNLRHYMDSPLEFITWQESKYCDELQRKGQTNVPIGKLNDLEIVFLHYKTEEEARMKWEHRVERINYSNLIFKFSKMNFCTERELTQFDQLQVAKKILFVPDDTSEYARYVDLKRLINANYVVGTKVIGEHK